MTAPLLLIDANQVCHRAFHTMGGLSYQGQGTGVVYGFFKIVLGLREQFGTDQFAFCFDYGRSRRHDIYPKYKHKRKQNRRELSSGERAAYDGMREQIKKLRRKLLRDVGFRNVFYQSGYEADDIIAAICQEWDHKRIVIVSSDHDFYQLLNNRVSIYNPAKKEKLTAKWFEEEFGLDPSQWADVKAIAGCTSDDVEGIEGIGEKTAAKFLRGDLKATMKTFAKIAEGNDIWRRNLKLVTLPLEGCEVPKQRRDEVTDEKWAKVADKLGMKTIRKRPKGIKER